MADNDVEIRVRVDDQSSRGLASVRRGVAALDAPMKRVLRGVLGLSRGLVAVGAAGSAVQVIAGVAAAAQQLAPAALILPGALLAGGAAMATLKIATAGFGEAVAAADPAAFAEATRDMAPAAVAAATAVRDLQPAFADLRREVQGQFFAGFADEIRSLGATYVPILKTGLGDIAESFNAISRNAATAAQTPFFQGAVTAVLADTGNMLWNMRSALANAATGLVGLGQIGATYLPALGTAVGDVAKKFGLWVQDNPEQIRAMIDSALAGFSSLGSIVGNVGSTIGSIFTGLAGDMGSPLSILAQLTVRMAAFFASVSAQTSLGVLGETLRAVSEVVSGLLMTALDLLAPILVQLGPLVTALAQAWGAHLTGTLQMLGPILLGIATFLTQHKEVLATLVPILMTSLAVYKGITIAMALYRGAMVAVGVATVVFNGIMAAARVGMALWTAVQWALNAALLANPIGLVVLAIAALVAALIFAWHNSETFRNIVTAAWDAVRAAIGAAIDWIVGAVAWFGRLPGMAAEWFGGMARSAGAGLGELVGWVAGLPGRILGALGNIGSMLFNSGVAMVAGFLDGLVSMWNNLMSWARDAMGWLRDLWPFSPAKDGPFSGSGYVTHSGKALMGDFAKSLRGGMPGVLASARQVMAATEDALNGNASIGLTAQGAGAGAGAGGVGATAGSAASSSGSQAGAGGGVHVTFGGNVDATFAAAFMKLVRSGHIQIQAAV